MKCDEVIKRILSAAHQFMRVHRTDSAVLIVPPEIFAEIMHKLTDVKVDKGYSSGHLGRHYVKSDPFIAHGNKMIVYKPIEFEDIQQLRTEDYLPAFTDPEVEKLRKRIENAKKKEAEQCGYLLRS